MRTLTIALIVTTFLASFSLCPIQAYEDSATTENSFLQNSLIHAWEDEISKKYTIGGEMIARAEGEEYYTEENEYVPQIVGAGGYYGDKDWQAFVAIYLWFVGLNGETGRGDFVADVDVGFGDLWKNLDFGIQAHVEVWWKKIIFFVDPMYVKVSTSNKNTNVIGSLSSDLELNMFLMDLAAGYRIADLALGSSTKSNSFKTWPSLAIDLYGGGRLVHLDSKLDLTLDTPIGVEGRRIRIDETWFDFIVGSRFIFDFTENLLLSIKSDIGGFGLGFSSDIDWNFVANIGYQLPWWGITPYLGYRVLYIDYEDGNGSDKFVYDVWQTGPQLGVGVRF